MSRRAFASGFTLVELLVAMAIFALIGVMAYGGLNNVITQREQNGQVMQRLRQVQQAFAIMSRDFEQLTPRPIRDELGSTRSPLQAGPLNVPPIEFTHGGWPNPLGVARSTQQRVAYALEDGQLVRYSWLELDRAPQSEAQKQVLLPDVTGLDVEFMNPPNGGNPANGSFDNQWPPLNTNQATQATLLPSAVSIKLILKDWGDVTRIVEVAHP